MSRCACTSAAPARPARAARARARSPWPPPAATAPTRRPPAPPATYTVDVPGGTLVITERPDGEIEMTGPAVIVAEGEIDADWLETATSA